MTRTVETVELVLAYNGPPVVEGVSLALVPGGITALVGPNGSGKSTVLRALAGLHAAHDGTVILDGRALAATSRRELARQLSFLPQAPIAPDGVTVRDLVGYGRYPHQGLLGVTRAEDRDAVAWALAATTMDGLADRPVEQLSGGERQRAWIAMALAQRTDLLLLDEPTTYLDLRFQVEVLDLVRWLADEHRITVAVVLHDLNQAAALADHMVVLAKRRVVATGRPDEVITSETIREAFGIDVTLVPDPNSGLPTCLPFRRRAARPPDA